jgi:hypothetical protein
MAAPNTLPIYSRIADIQWGSTDGNGGSAGPLKTANTAKDGTGTVLTVFTADADNGGRVDRLRIRAAGTNILTVLRVFINNGSTNATAANNCLYEELTLPATTLSETGQLLNQEIKFNDGEGLVLPPGYKINVTLGTTVSAGYFVSAVGGKY